MNYFLLALADIPALFLGWYLIQGRLGRRWTNTCALMLCGISLCVPIFIDPKLKTWIIIMSLLGKAGTAASFMIICQQAAEILPTTLRGEGMGFCSTLSNIAGVFVPYISYLASTNLILSVFS